MHQIRLFFIALEFFTRIPKPHWVGFEPAWLNRAVRYFPAVGIVVGTVCAVVWWLASLALPPVLAAWAAIVAGLLLTGAFHEDGFADACDGFGGGRTREQVLAIMRDSRVGAYGAIGVTAVLVLRAESIAALPIAWTAVALVCGHAVSRFAATTLIAALPYARDESDAKAKPVAAGATWSDVVIAAVFGLGPALGAAGWADLHERTGLALGLVAGMAAAIGAAWGAGRYFARRIGGYTGDALGAAQQVAELAFLLTMVAAGR